MDKPDYKAIFQAFCKKTDIEPTQDNFVYWKAGFVEGQLYQVELDRKRIKDYEVH